jgi:hypothetical protein
MTRPIQFHIFYFPDCIEKKVHQKQPKGMRSTKKKGGKDSLPKGQAMEKEEGAREFLFVLMRRKVQDRLQHICPGH